MRTKREGFSIFVPFRSSRLPLRRGIRSLQAALEIAADLRAGRFHDAESLFIVEEPGNRIIDEQAARRALGVPEAGSPPVHVETRHERAARAAPLRPRSTTPRDAHLRELEAELENALVQRLERLREGLDRLDQGSERVAVAWSRAPAALRTSTRCVAAQDSITRKLRAIERTRVSLERCVRWRRCAREAALT